MKKTETAKSDRVFNKERIRRIKEASELAKQTDPNWYKDAPESSITNEEEEMSVTGMKTPPFLKEKTPTDYSEPTSAKKLTLNELTQCTKDSSQLKNIINSNDAKKKTSESSNIQNHLESSRNRIINEREYINRKVAENLDKASEKWHNQLKEFSNINSKTQDSRGVRSTLFDDSDNEKFEREDTEKALSKRFNTDHINRLDMLLQRGLRGTFSKNLGSLKGLNERSFNRWSSRLNSMSNISDLKYALLNSRINLGLHSNYADPKIKNERNKRNLNLKDINSNMFQTILQPNSLVSNNSNISPQSFNIQPPNFYTPDQNMNYKYFNPQNFTDVFQNMNASSGINNAYDPYQWNNCIWTNPFNQFCQTSRIPIPQNFYPYNPIPNQPVQNDTTTKENNINNNPELIHNFELVYNKINSLAEKLDKLNETVDKISWNSSPAINVKPIIKQNKTSSLNSISSEELQKKLICNCSDCNFNNVNAQKIDKKVHFDVNVNTEILDQEIYNSKSNLREIDFKEVHPLYINKRLLDDQDARSKNPNETNCKVNPTSVNKRRMNANDARSKIPIEYSQLKYPERQH